MPFPPHERKALLAVKGIGPTVIARFEQMGFEFGPALKSEVKKGYQWD